MDSFVFAFVVSSVCSVVMPDLLNSLMSCARTIGHRIVITHFSLQGRFCSVLRACTYKFGNAVDRCAF